MFVEMPMLNLPALVSFGNTYVLSGAITHPDYSSTKLACQSPSGSKIKLYLLETFEKISNCKNASFRVLRRDSFGNHRHIGEWILSGGKWRKF